MHTPKTHTLLKFDAHGTQSMQTHAWNRVEQKSYLSRIHPWLALPVYRGTCTDAEGEGPPAPCHPQAVTRWPTGQLTLVLSADTAIVQPQKLPAIESLLIITGMVPFGKGKLKAQSFHR